jgi:hypothetical protein
MRVEHQKLATAHALLLAPSNQASREDSKVCRGGKLQRKPTRGRLLSRGLVRTRSEQRSVMGFEIHTVLQALAYNEMWLLRAPRPLVAHRDLTCVLRPKGRRSGKCQDHPAEKQLRQALSHIALQALHELAIQN